MARRFGPMRGFTIVYFKFKAILFFDIPAAMLWLVATRLAVLLHICESIRRQPLPPLPEWRLYVTAMNLLLLLFSLLVAWPPTQGPSFLPVKKGSRVIYDNDDHRDVYTDEYLLALNSMGYMKVKAIITTYSDWEYPQFVEGRQMLMGLARQSGLRRLPKLFDGTNQRLVMPPDHRMEATVPLPIDGSRYLVEVAKKCSRANPLFIIAGGQLTSIANAWLLDPSIADKVVVMGVFGAEKLTYNAGLDKWAWAIVLAKFRVVAIPDDGGSAYAKSPKVPKARIAAELNQSVPLFALMYQKHHPVNGGPNECDPDGHPAILLSCPDYVTQWRGFRFAGLTPEGMPLLTDDPEGPVFQAEDADQAIATGQFWSLFHALNRRLHNRTKSD